MDFKTLFNNLCFDLKDKICEEVGIIKYRNEKLNMINKQLLMKYGIREITDDMDEMDIMCVNMFNERRFDRLNKIYEIFNLGFSGELCQSDNNIHSFWKNIGSYNKRYYNELDYLMNCFITQKIEDNEINYSYEIKPNRIQKYQYIDFEDAMNYDEFEEDNYDFQKYKKYEISEDYIPNSELSYCNIGNYKYH
jgi:hypothetical protein